MKRFLALTLALLIVMTMAACGGSGGKAADPNTLVVWHDKEAAGTALAAREAHNIGSGSWRTSRTGSVCVRIRMRSGP